jgi:protein-glutamine gamma-glutamyltransferase
MASNKIVLPSSAPLARADVLWLAGALALAAVPHVLLIAPWVSVLFFSAVIWRSLIAWQGRAMARRWQILALAAVGMMGIYLNFHTLVGRDAGVALLLIMASLKLLEMRTRRDAMLTAFLGYFLVLTEFLYSQSMLLGAYALTLAWLITAALVGIHRPGNDANFRGRLVPAGWLLLQAVPMMLVLFVLFPRVGGPLWSMPQDARSGKSGLSDKLEPGTVSNLALSDEVAFRVEFEGAIPRPSQLYWRGPVMWDLENNIWRARKNYSAKGPAFTPLGESIAYSVALEASNKPWLFALDIATKPPTDARVTPDNQLLALQPVNARMRYRVMSHLQYSLGENETTVELQRALALPNDGNKQTRELAQSWQREGLTGDALVKKALAFFNGNKFSYTLAPPMLGENPMDEFLFRTRNGFCEHYASSFVYLMRAAGVPARIVTGYQGGEVNPVGKYLIVRQAEAHAWAEVWLAGRGWVRIDPTAAVSPDRVEIGMEAAIPSTNTVAGIPFPKQITWLNSLRLNWDALNNRYNLWVLGYNMDRQKRLLSSLGFGDIDWREMATGLAVLMSVAGAVLAFFLLVPGKKTQQDSAQKSYAVFCAKLARASIARLPHEGPWDFLRRIEHERPAIAGEARAIVETYAGVRYGNAPKYNERLLKQSVREFKPH